MIAQIEAGTGVRPAGLRDRRGRRRRVGDAASPKLPGKPLAANKITEKYLVKKKADMGGEHIVQANALFETQGYVVHLRFDSTGAKQFDDIANAHFGEPLAILLDGKVISAPTLNARATTSATRKSAATSTPRARETFPARWKTRSSTPVRVEQERSVSATLGKDSIRSGVISGLVGLLLTFRVRAVVLPVSRACWRTSRWSSTSSCSSA